MTVLISACIIGFSHKDIITKKFSVFSCIGNQSFSSDSSNFNLSSINCFMSSLIWIQSCLLPITPIRKSSAYLMYFSRLILSSISSPAGYFSRSLTISLILQTIVYVSFHQQCFVVFQLTWLYDVRVVLQSDYPCVFFPCRIL